MSLNENEKQEIIIDIFKSATDINICIFQMQANRKIADFCVIPTTILLFHAIELYLKTWLAILTNWQTHEQLRDLLKKMSHKINIDYIKNVIKEYKTPSIIWDSQIPVLEKIYNDKYKSFYRHCSYHPIPISDIKSFFSYKYFHEVQNHNILPIGSMLSYMEALRETIVLCLGVQVDIKSLFETFKCHTIYFPEKLEFSKTTKCWSHIGSCGLYTLKNCSLISS